MYKNVLKSLCAARQFRSRMLDIVKKEREQGWESRRSDFINKRREIRKRGNQKRAIAMTRNRHHQNGPNGLELAGNALLDALGIKYETQALVCGFLVDVFIPDKRIVIQWGDFWHGFKGTPYPSQQKQIIRDRKQDCQMKQAGYIVIRFWEHEVKKQKSLVIDQIKTAIS